MNKKESAVVKRVGNFMNRCSSCAAWEIIAVTETSSVRWDMLGYLRSGGQACKAYRNIEQAAKALKEEVLKELEGHACVNSILLLVWSADQIEDHQNAVRLNKAQRDKLSGVKYPKMQDTAQQRMALFADLLAREKVLKTKGKEQEISQPNPPPPEVLDLSAIAREAKSDHDEIDYESLEKLALEAWNESKSRAESETSSVTSHRRSESEYRIHASAKPGENSQAPRSVQEVMMESNRGRATGSRLISRGRGGRMMGRHWMPAPNESGPTEYGEYDASDFDDYDE